jgi:hypothetical protein
MGPVRVSHDVVDFKTRVELSGPKLRIEIMRRDRELGKRKASPCAPEDDAATILRRSVDPGLQDVEAHLIAVHDHDDRTVCPFKQALLRVGKAERDVPERCERTKDILHNTVGDNVSFLWSCLVDSKFVIQKADYVLQKKELRPIEFHIRQHVANQGVPAMRNWVKARTKQLPRGLPRVVLLLLVRDVRIRLSGKKRLGSRDACSHG